MLVLGTLFVPVTEQDAPPHPQPKSEPVPNITPDPKGGVHVNERYSGYCFT